MRWKYNCKTKNIMKKVINASIGGRSFALDEDAYSRLSAYFDHFKARLNKDSQSMGEEVMSDLENRIAELFDQGTGGAAYRVVDFELVSKVVGQLGMPDGSAEPLDFSQGLSNGTGNNAKQSSGSTESKVKKHEIGELIFNQFPISRLIVGGSDDFRFGYIISYDALGTFQF